MLGFGVLLLGQALGPAGSGVEPAVGRAFELNWQAPAGCPSSAEVRLATERLLSSSRAPAVQGSVRATARVRKNRERFELALTLGEGASARTRELHAPACEELVQAAALVVALAVDPSLALAEEGSRAEAIEPASSPCVESRVDASPSTSPPPQPAAPARECPVLPVVAASVAAPSTPVLRPRWGLGAGTAVAFGALPGVLPRAELSASYVTSSLRAELGAFAGFGSEGPRSVGGMGGVFELWSAVPRVCRRWETTGPRFDACAVAELGWLRATGLGVDRPLTQSSLWFAPGFGLDIRFAVGERAEMGLGAQLSWVATRTRFEIGGESLFRPSALVPALRLSAQCSVF